MDEKLDLIKVEEATSDEQTEQRSQLEEQQFQKRTAAENYQHTQERMRERNERRIERYEEETAKLREQISLLTSETKEQHGELERLRERGSWKVCLVGFAGLLSSAGAVIVKCADKSDAAKLFWGIPQPAWFFVGLMFIALASVFSFFLTIRR